MTEQTGDHLAQLPQFAKQNALAIAPAAFF